jgi:hypothetical protein
LKKFVLIMALAALAQPALAADSRGKDYTGHNHIPAGVTTFIVDNASVCTGTGGRIQRAAEDQLYNQAKVAARKLREQGRNTRIIIQSAGQRDGNLAYGGNQTGPSVRMADHCL